MISTKSYLLPFSLFLLFIGAAIAAKGQNKSGFLKGDEELIRYLEKNLANANFEDTVGYFFSIAAVQFDSSGRISSLTYSSEGNNQFKALATRFITGTKDMWNRDVAKNNLLLIPFEIISMKRDGEDPTGTIDRMLSYEFIKLFRSAKALKAILLKPVMIVNYVYRP